MSQKWRGYVPCSGPSGGPCASAERLLRILAGRDPYGRSLGIYNPRGVRGGRSWSVHACGRALDWAPQSALVGWQTWAWLIEHADELDVQLIIWHRVQWGGAIGYDDRPYTGEDDHRTHLHIEVRGCA